MNLLLSLQDELATRWREALTVDALSQLSDRRLDDTNLTRAQIRRVARIAARAGAEGAPLSDIIAQIDLDDRASAETISVGSFLQRMVQTMGGLLTGARTRDV